jgi:hypothetical protein
MVAAALDTPPTPSTDEVDSMYHQLRDTLGVATEQQMESSLQRWAKVSVSSSGRSKASQQRTVMELPTAVTMSSPARAPTRLQLGHPRRHPEPPTCHQARRGDEWVRSEHHARNPYHDRCNDRERCNLSPEGPGPKAFWSNVCNVHFPKRSRVPNNVVKYDHKTNPNILLDDYALHAGQVGQMTTSSSSNSSPFTWLTQPGSGSITCLENRSIAGRISKRS